jgi:hypothetical protein
MGPFGIRFVRSGRSAFIQSLRALAAELGTSHQLLGFYLKDLDRWRHEKYKREAKAIRDRAEKETRHTMPWEL